MQGVDGFDVDWYSRDARGFIGHFTSAGSLFVPGVFFDNPNLSYFHGYFSRLPRRCDASLELKADRPGEFLSWIEMAERGMHSYDFRQDRGSYVAIARPLIPLKAVDVPPDIVNGLPVICESFAAVKEISRAAIGHHA